MRRGVRFIPLLTVLLLAPPCLSRTWYITPDGSGDAPTIQAGVDSAAVADTVLLAPGTYSGIGNKDLIFHGRDISLISESGPSTTVLDCEQDGRAFTLVLGETQATIIRGITVRNGQPQPEGAGGALFCVSSSPTVIDCVFEDCIAVAGNPGAGGGAFCQFGNPTFDGCTFRNNSGSGYVTTGGGLCLTGCGTVAVSDCLFEGNTLNPGSGGAALSWWEGDDLTISGCTFRENSGERGAALFVFDAQSAHIDQCSFVENVSTNEVLMFLLSTYSLSQCTIQGNVANNYGVIRLEHYSSGTIANTIIAFNDSRAVDCHGSAAPAISCSDVFGNTDGDWVGCLSGQGTLNGNLCNDPLFCNPGAGDLTLHADSPCLPGNHPTGWNCGLIGALGQGCGPVALTPQTWARLKAIYK